MTKDSLIFKLLGSVFREMRREMKIAARFMWFAEHRSDKSIAIDPRMSKNDTLASLIYHVKWSIAWKLFIHSYYYYSNIVNKALQFNAGT